MHDVMQLLTLMFQTLNINCLDYFPSNYPRDSATAAAKLSSQINIVFNVSLHIFETEP